MRSISTLVGVEAPDACGHIQYKLQVFKFGSNKNLQKPFSTENGTFSIFHYPFFVKLNVRRRDCFARHGRVLPPVSMLMRTVRNFRQVNHRKQREDERLHERDENRERQ